MQRFIIEDGLHFRDLPMSIQYKRIETFLLDMMDYTEQSEIGELFTLLYETKCTFEKEHSI